MTCDEEGIEGFRHLDKIGDAGKIIRDQQIRPVESLIFVLCGTPDNIQQHIGKRRIASVFLCLRKSLYQVAP